MAAEMLSAYYCCGCDSSDLFQDLAIASSPDYEKHRNKYHVVQIDMLEMSMQLKQGRTAQLRDNPYAHMTLTQKTPQTPETLNLEAAHMIHSLGHMKLAWDNVQACF